MMVALFPWPFPIRNRVYSGGPLEIPQINDLIVVSKKIDDQLPSDVIFPANPPIFFFRPPWAPLVPQ